MRTNTAHCVANLRVLSMNYIVLAGKKYRNMKTMQKECKKRQERNNCP